MVGPSDSEAGEVDKGKGTHEWGIRKAEIIQKKRAGEGNLPIVENEPNNV